MNCRQAQESLPLYVGGDLAERRAHSITAHLQSCADCAEVANEYRGTREMLRDFAAPAFAEGTYAGIRQRVLREIESEPVAPAWPQTMANFFQPRLTRGFATALLIAISLFAAYFVINRRKNEPSVTEQHPATVHPNANADVTSSPSVKDQAVFSALPNPRHKDQPVGVRQQQRKTVLNRVSEQLARATADLPDAKSTVATQPDNSAQPTLFLPHDPTASEKTLRMEIQTKDPNIRIIWFTQHEPKRAIPNSKGT